MKHALLLLALMLSAVSHVSAAGTTFIHNGQLQDDLNANGHNINGLGVLTGQKQAPYLFYSGMAANGSKWAIQDAGSTDGHTFTPLTTISTTTPAQDGPRDCNILTQPNDPYRKPLKVNGLYWLVCTAGNFGSGYFSIYSSADLRTWTYVEEVSPQVVGGAAATTTLSGTINSSTVTLPSTAISGLTNGTFYTIFGAAGVPNGAGFVYNFASTTQTLVWYSGATPSPVATATFSAVPISLQFINNLWSPDWYTDGTNYYVLFQLSTQQGSVYGTPGLGYVQMSNATAWASGATPTFGTYTNLGFGTGYNGPFGPIKVGSTWYLLYDRFGYNGYMSSTTGPLTGYTDQGGFSSHFQADTSVYAASTTITCSTSSSTLTLGSTAGLSNGSFYYVMGQTSAIPYGEGFTYNSATTTTQTLVASAGSTTGINASGNLSAAAVTLNLYYADESSQVIQVSPTLFRLYLARAGANSNTVYYSESSSLTSGSWSTATPIGGNTGLLPGNPLGLYNLDDLANALFAEPYQVPSMYRLRVSQSAGPYSTLTAAKAAASLLETAGASNVTIDVVDGSFTDKNLAITNGECWILENGAKWNVTGASTGDNLFSFTGNGGALLGAGQTISITSTTGPVNAGLCSSATYGYVSNLTLSATGASSSYYANLCSAAFYAVASLPTNLYLPNVNLVCADSGSGGAAVGLDIYEYGGSSALTIYGSGNITFAGTGSGGSMYGISDIGSSTTGKGVYWTGNITGTTTGGGINCISATYNPVYLTGNCQTIGTSGNNYAVSCGSASYAVTVTGKVTASGYAFSNSSSAPLTIGSFTEGSSGGNTGQTLKLTGDRTQFFSEGSATSATLTGGAHNQWLYGTATTFALTFQPDTASTPDQDIAYTNSGTSSCTFSVASTNQPTNLYTPSGGFTVAAGATIHLHKLASNAWSVK